MCPDTMLSSIHMIIMLLSLLATRAKDAWKCVSL